MLHGLADPEAELATALHEENPTLQQRSSIGANGSLRYLAPPSGRGYLAPSSNRMESGMAATKRFGRHLMSVLGSWLIIAVAVIVSTRLSALYLHKNVLVARSERLFFDWSYGAAGLALRHQLLRAAPLLRDGEAVCLIGDVVDQETQPRRDSAWSLVMATYFLSRQIVIVPAAASKGEGIPACRRAVLLGRPDQSMLLWRSPLGDNRR